MKTYEINFDGLVGPTHNYAGLAFGNLASDYNSYTRANPLEAVKQGLEKMKLMHHLGIKQAILPPHARPNVPLLRSLGFSGKNNKILKDVYRHEPRLLAACCSSSSMWAANAATLSPSIDSGDGRVQITPANMNTNFHRSQESEATAAIFKKIFASDKHFCHHQPLPSSAPFADEGAANYTRFCKDYGSPGVALFVYGIQGFPQDVARPEPQNFPARQTKEASMAIARSHQLDFEKVVFAQQNPDVIDQGVFHNDVISVGNQDVFFYHEESFIDTEKVVAELSKKADFPIHFVEVKSSELSVKDAVSSYLFNSQLITLDNGEMMLIAPGDCEQNREVQEYILQLIKSDKRIKQVQYSDCRQSMRNGGGPACLRLRAVVNEKELKSIHQKVFVNDELIETLTHWADKHYRDRLHVDELLDPKIIDESNRALDELSQILGLGSIYYFQK